MQKTEKSSPQIIIVSGRSGSGKTSVLNILEDFGYYCLDNLPLSLILTAVHHLLENQIDKIALGIDIRTPKADLSQFGNVLDELQKQCHTKATTIYTTADMAVLVARFGATRRIHPLIDNADNLPCAIEAEVALLEPVTIHADITLDTSTLNIHELKEKMRVYLGIDNHVQVHVLSFGFKYGSPIDADFIFDVRILPNPHWQANLRAQTGNDKDVQAFFANYPEVGKMADDIGQFLVHWLPNFLNNNRHTVTIAIGCTGGKHRSVYISEKVATQLKAKLPPTMPVIIKHREKRHW